jgi:hypothetical protein
MMMLVPMTIPSIRRITIVKTVKTHFQVDLPKYHLHPTDLHS